jgi:hypothetical protein
VRPSGLEFDAEALVAELVATHGVHTVILYGSRARGDAGPDSDIDLAAFRGQGPEERDVRAWRGLSLDAFIYPDSATHKLTPEFLRMRGGQVLLQRGDFGLALLASLDDLHARAPTALSDPERLVRRAWPHKMLKRAARADAEGNYRRHWLLFDLLETHFALANCWYQGPKVALRELATSDPALHAVFVAALEPGASLETVAKLVRAVVGDLPGASDP